MLDIAFILPFLLIYPPGAWSAISTSLMFAISLTAIFYMAAYAYQHPTLLMLAKEELAALILSIVIVASWGMLETFLSLSSYQIICITDPQLCRGFVPPSNQLYAGQLDIAYYSLEILKNKLITMYGTLYLYEILIGFLSTLSFPIGSPLPAVNIISLSIMPFDGLSLLSNAHTTIVEAIGQLVAVIMAKQWLLIFAKEAIPPILLPLGVMMRAFPFYRSTGSSIIAASIALYFIYPISIVGSNYLIFDVYFKHNVVDFVYAPAQFGFGPTTGPSTLAEVKEYEKERKGGEEQIKELMKVFTEEDPLRSAVKESCGSGIFSIVCHIANFFVKTWNFAKNAAKKVWKIFKFMWSFSGDLFRAVLGKGLPTSAAAGLYDFVISENVILSQFLVLVVVTSVIEIIITVTMYRNISLMIGGEVEIAGLAKLV